MDILALASLDRGRDVSELQPQGRRHLDCHWTSRAEFTWALAFAGPESQRLLAGTETGLLVSLDGGNTWEGTGEEQGGRNRGQCSGEGTGDSVQDGADQRPEGRPTASHCIRLRTSWGNAHPTVSRDCRKSSGRETTGKIVHCPLFRPPVPPPVPPTDKAFPSCGAWDWPKDPAVHDKSYEYMLGDDLLVACMVDETTTREVYFHEGEWVDFWDRSRTIKGPAVVKEDVPLSRFPVYIRKGATHEIPLP